MLKKKRRERKMSKENPFEDLKDRFVELNLKIDGQPLRIIPEVGDAEMFMLFRGTKPEDEVRRLTKVLIGMLKRSYPKATDEQISNYVAKNYGQLFEEIAVIYGFVTRDKLEQVKKKATDKIAEN